MRIFGNSAEAINEVKRDVYKMGVIVKPNTMQDKIVKGDEDYITKELQMYTMCILNPSSTRDTVKDEMWCLAEIKERLSKEEVNPGTAYRMRGVWEEFIHNGKFSYSYNERMSYQIDGIIDEIKKNPDSRQLIIQIFNAKIDHSRIGSGDSRIPCSMHYQFMVREEKLDIMYFMRSCDINEHWTNDIYLAFLLQEFIARQSGYEVGKLFFTAASLHSYKKDWPKEVI